MAGTAERMWAIPGATLTMARADLVAGGSGVVRIPVPTFLVQHAEGLLLLDTGLAPAAAGDPGGHYADLGELLLIDYPPERTVEAGLSALGFRCRDVTHVVLSHGHFDHTGGLSLFAHAKLYRGEGEIQHVEAHANDPVRAYRIDDFAGLETADWTEFGDDLDVFGDGAVRILSAPGHTPGNAALLVRLPNRAILLTADTAHLRQAWRDELAMPMDPDHPRARASIRRLKEVAAAEGAEVWIPHDPDDWRAFGAPGSYR
ncbi:N-acyl homoserine lactonase family protein [Amycolatopsis sp. PS_44_ISF1]|uniref:N-acyl homoserine lactonase family protein n=1 Tax=Amycolatopsis sp. PS_44_ISF1 TaxID=2974917 RepID=UPI0028DDDF0B|nr:N-acyl homoserine lactonase family protein [Amycolatopsis sp. PS_44_ISF1]MDT8910153.1 N-acyl homoserine lactonase family protein [Amycolatopsis sp. PS_44_ISF1]